MRFQSYFNTAIKIIELYNSTIPLSRFLKKYFSENKKHGSKDRKFITHVCYNYYRIGNAVKDFNKNERLKISIFLCNENVDEWKILYDDNWLNNWTINLDERIAFIKSEYTLFNENEIFSPTNLLSTKINISEFLKSHLIQPDVFLRIRNHQYKNVTDKLNQYNISFKEIEENCISIYNTTKLENIIDIDNEAVIQDYSSQRIKEFLTLIQSEINVWDCCAGSGGKSILTYDILQNINLTVSDIRASIIHNLKERFNKAGIKNYTFFVTDITNPEIQIANSSFDLIICDAPCTGSGTWSRTPEQLYFFQSEKINAYTKLQKEIISNTIKHLKKQSYFLYITCSVFKAENEDIIDFIQDKFQLTLIKVELLEGYNKKADTMFAALFKN